jgi:outer membrane protein OmpA-like peptidoglycan-associated protein
VKARLCLFAAILFLVAACAKKPVTQAPPAPPAPAQPPAPKQNIFALLEDPTGKGTAIVVSNSGGTQDISLPNQAVRVEREDVAPTAPYTIDRPTARRLFGAALDAMPVEEARFVLYFDEVRDTLNAEAQALIPAILKSIHGRNSTDVQVTGHTDMSGTTEGNYQLGLRRAETVRTVLAAQGVAESSMEVTSHGEVDPVVKTARGQAEPLNRRVEVIVH